MRNGGPVSGGLRPRRVGLPGDDRWRPSSFQFVGADGYNRGGAEGWRSFAEIFGPAHVYAESLGLPLVLGEVGSVEDPADSGAKARWFLDAARTITGWRDVATVEWSDAVAYRPDSSSQSLSDWAAASRDPAFSGR